MAKRNGSERRRLQLHQSGIKPPRPEIVELHHLSQSEIHEVRKLPREDMEYYLLQMADALECVQRAAMEYWQDSTKVPEELKDPLANIYYTQLSMYHRYGWVDEEGRPTDKMPENKYHCEVETATLDTEDLALDTVLPHDGSMHTMGFKLKGKGGMIIAIKTPAPDDNAQPLVAQDIVNQWCASGHPKPQR